MTGSDDIDQLDTKPNYTNQGPQTKVWDTL